MDESPKLTTLLLKTIVTVTIPLSETLQRGRGGKGLNILPTTPYWFVGAVGGVYFLYKELRQRKRKRNLASPSIPTSPAQKSHIK